MTQDTEPKGGGGAAGEAPVQPPPAPAPAAPPPATRHKHAEVRATLAQPLHHEGRAYQPGEELSLPASLAAVLARLGIVKE